MSALRVIWPAWAMLCAAWAILAPEAWESAVAAVCALSGVFFTAYVWNAFGWWDT